MPDSILTPAKPYTADELSAMWPQLRAELLAYSQILEREPTVEHAQVRVGIKAAVQMGDAWTKYYARVMSKLRAIESVSPPRKLSDFQDHSEYMVARKLAP